MLLKGVIFKVRSSQKPHIINTDKAAAFNVAIAPLKSQGKCPMAVQHRQVRYLNNIIECDHGQLKPVIKPMLGFKSMKTADATLKGIETRRALRKGQASVCYYGHPLGEMHLVNQDFGR